MLGSWPIDTNGASPFNPDRQCHEMLAAGASRRVQFLPITQQNDSNS